MNDERREVRAKIRTYKDKQTGDDKNFYATIGTAWVSEHGTKIKVSLDTTPVNWDGTFFINEPYEKKEPKSETHAFNKQVHDKLPDDDAITLETIPF
jgi:hypothetical protein